MQNFFQFKFLFWTFFFFFQFVFIYLLMAALGLFGCTWAFSSCNVWASHSCGFSYFGAWTVQ